MYKNLSRPRAFRIFDRFSWSDFYPIDWRSCHLIEQAINCRLSSFRICHFTASYTFRPFSGKIFNLFLLRDPSNFRQKINCFITLLLLHEWLSCIFEQTGAISSNYKTNFFRYQGYPSITRLHSRTFFRCQDCYQENNRKYATFEKSAVQGVVLNQVKICYPCLVSEIWVYRI